MEGAKNGRKKEKTSHRIETRKFHGKYRIRAKHSWLQINSEVNKVAEILKKIQINFCYFFTKISAKIVSKNKKKFYFFIC